MAEHDDAAARRSDFVRALRDELEGYERMGKTDRAKQVRAEIERIEGKPSGRAEKPTEQASAPKPTTRRKG